MHEIEYRKAVADDALAIAELIAISSDGVAVIEWQAEADKQESCTALEIGTQTYRQADGDYSYTNCLIAETRGRVAGMLLAFRMADDCTPEAGKARPTAQDINVFAPYMYLEEPGSWYICGVATYPAYRGQGIGSRFMAEAEKQAQEQNLDKLSLVVFEQNTGALRLYQRLGYKVVDHAPVVPHPLIPFTGEALLMVKYLSGR